MMLEEGYQILVLRHAHRPKIQAGQFGHELTLTQEGKQASMNLGKRLRECQWKEVHTSPVKRCEQTARYFLKGTGQKVPIIKSNVLGAPGPFVSIPEQAGPVFMKSSSWEIAKKLISHQALPGMKTLEEGGAHFVSYLKTLHSFPCLMISHDIIVSLLCTYFLKSEAWFPHFLEGFCVKVQSDDVMITKLWMNDENFKGDTRISSSL